MKFTRSIFSSSIFVAGLLCPSLVDANVFGYASLKAGYSHQPSTRLDLVSYANAMADNGVFINAFSTASIPLGGSVGVGYYFTPDVGIRAEVEYLYGIGLSSSLENRERKVGGIKQDPIKLAISAQTILSNVYFDYYVTPSINLYLSVGAGMAIASSKLHAFDSTGVPNQSKESTISISRNTFVYQVGAGIGYALTDQLGLDLNVRYVGLGKYEAGANVPPTLSNTRGKASLSAISTLLGLIYRF